MSDTTSTIKATEHPAEMGKILRFPTLLETDPAHAAETEAPASAADRRRAALVKAQVDAQVQAQVEEAMLDVAPPSGSIWERLAVVRRGRGERAAAAKSTRSKRAETQAVQPSVSQLVTWMLNLRRGGVGSVYWNAAKLPLDVALVRAARLDDAAVINVIGHRLLVVEPLRARSEAPVAAQ